MTTKKSKHIVSHILSLYTKYGNTDYIGEPITQLEHALQTAFQAITHCKNDKTDKNDIIIASFLHDIGHILDLDLELDNKTKPSNISMITNHNENLGRLHHEEIGSAFLRENGFPPSVYKLVEGHVNAKRYMISKYPEYRSTLSLASLKTLEFQGGLMTDDEMTDFEAHEFFDKILLLRSFDDKAKETTFSTEAYNSIHKYIFELMLDVLQK
jgi:putative nucleotidyltransferase with HDIG domain